MEKNHSDSMKNLNTLRQILAEKREKENRKDIHAAECSGVPNKTLMKILKSSKKVST